jgi:hypothetical protein
LVILPALNIISIVIISKDVTSKVSIIIVVSFLTILIKTLFIVTSLKTSINATLHICFYML